MPDNPRRALPAVLLAVLLALGSAGCTGDGSGGAGTGGDGDATAVEPIPTRTTIDTVAGRLDKRKRRRLERRITETFDAWVDSAYVGGDYPRADFADAYAVFTKDTRRKARRDSRLLTNAAVGERVDTVRATSRRLRLDVLAPEGTAVGVTARFVLVLAMDGEVQRTDRVAGRLMLGYTGGGWKAFGYDVKRGAVR